MKLALISFKKRRPLLSVAFIMLKIKNDEETTASKMIKHLRKLGLTDL